MNIIPDYSQTEEQLIDRLLNPREGFNGIAPLPNEYLMDGSVDPQQYLARILATPKYKHLANKLVSRKPAETPSVWDITKTNLGRLWPAIETATIIGQEYAGNAMMGINENPKLDFVSQEDYQKRIKAGETPEEIWPHLTGSNNRTWADWSDWMNKQLYGPEGIGGPGKIEGVVNKDGQVIDLFEGFDKQPSLFGDKTLFNMGKKGKLGWSDLINPKWAVATQRLSTRKAWYEKGGWIDEDGWWREANGMKAIEQNATWTPVEWNTREMYEKRAAENTNWHSGILKTAKQEILFEWWNPKSDAAVAGLWERNKERMNAPSMQALQKWSQSTEWGESWANMDWEALTKKTYNAILGAAPSVIIGGGAGAATLAATKDPAKATKAAFTIAGLLEGSSMYEQTYDWAISNGFDEEAAMKLAADYYETYAVASMAWERIPFSRMFRRTTKLSERAALINKTHDKFHKRAFYKIKETAIGAFPGVKNLTVKNINFSKARAIFTQGLAEGITELGQYSTDIYLQSEYKGIPAFESLHSEVDLFDINEAIDAVVGGFGMGGIVGGFGGQTIEGTEGAGEGGIGVKSTVQGIADRIFGPKKTDLRKDLKKQKDIREDKSASAVGTTDETTAPSPSVTTGTVPSTTSEYIERIVDQDINTTPLNPGLVNQIKNENIPESDLTKKIFIHQRPQYENYPIKKLADIIESEGWGPLENSNLTDAQKTEYKAKVAQELIRQKKKPLENKDNLTESEQKKLDTLDDINIDKAIESIATGKGLDSLLESQLDKSLDKKLDKQIEKAVVKGGGIAVTPEMLAQAEDIKPTKTKAKSEKVPAPPEGIEVTPEMLAQATTEDAESIALGKKQGEKVREEVLKEIEDSGQEQKDKKESLAPWEKKSNKSTDPESPNYYIDSEKSIVSKLSNPKLQELLDKQKGKEFSSMEKVRDNQALNAEKTRREAAKKERLDKKPLSPAVQKAVDERLAKQEKEFKDKRELELRKKVIEERGPAVISMNLKKLKLHIKKLRTFKDLESKIELELALEELAEMEANKKARIEKQQKENIVEPIEDIALGSDIDNVVNSTLEKIGVKDIGDVGKKPDGLSVKESEAIENEVSENENELINKNCLTKGE